MKREELDEIWNYYLSLEKDMDLTSSYVEPRGQEEVLSFAFAKIIILACTEIESVFKVFCRELGEENGNIGEYKRAILREYPTLVDAEISIPRLHKTIKPFRNWDNNRLSWWDAYQHVKHDRGNDYSEASYINAVSSLGALYLLIFFLAYKTSLFFEDYKSTYIDSEYQSRYVFSNPNKRISDFAEMGMAMNETIVIKTN